MECGPRVDGSTGPGIVRDAVLGNKVNYTGSACDEISGLDRPADDSRLRLACI